MIGGGGGGGGTAECTVPYMFGYGFSMHGIWRKTNATVNATASATSTLSKQDASVLTAVDDVIRHDDSIDYIDNATATATAANNNSNNNNAISRHDPYSPPPAPSSASPPSPSSSSPPSSHDDVSKDDHHDTNYRQRQYDYDLVGALLHEAAVSNECSSTGRFALTNMSPLLISSPFLISSPLTPTDRFARTRRNTIRFTPMFSSPLLVGPTRVTLI